MQTKLIITADGSHSLFLSDINEQYHSVNGALTESMHVYIEKGFRFHPSKKPNVFEIGFGTGLNVLLTALEATNEKRKTYYYTIEKYPLSNEITNSLNYGNLISETAKSIFAKIHESEWEKPVEITPYFVLYKAQKDLTTTNFELDKKFNIVFFDAFGPDKQPEMWRPEILKKIADICVKDSVFVTYSAKGEVRRKLSAAGFEMERIPGPPGKKEMLRGIKRG